MTIQEQIAIMQAFADGKLIETSPRFARKSQWQICRDPVWNWMDNDYRVKVPEPDTIPWDIIDTKYNYTARDADGSFFLYSKEPMQQTSRWVIRDGKDMHFTQIQGITLVKNNGLPWDQSLVKRPE